MVWPLANKGVSAWGLNFGCTSMSRTGCMRGVSDFVRRSLAIQSGGISARHRTTMPTRCTPNGILAGTRLPNTSSTDTAPAACNNLPHARRVERRVAGIDADEEAIRGGAEKSLLLQQRVVEAWQPVKRQYAEKRCQCAEQNDQLKRHRNIGRQAEQRFAADVQRIVHGVGPPLHQQRDRRHP